MMLLPACCALGQILQNRPELCGDKNAYVQIPAGLSATVNKSNGRAVLWVGQNHSIQLQGVDDDLLEVCRLTPTELASFGSNGVGTQVNVVDTSNFSVSDSFSAYNPATSPDRRWVAFRRFYPPQSEIQISEEYLLYDFRASAKANRRGATPATSEYVGREIYPAVQDGVPVDVLDIPKPDSHSWRSESFFWSADSRALVFADSVGPRLSVVLVTLDDEQLTTYAHTVSASDVCTGDVADADLTLGGADISGRTRTLAITATFNAQNAGCSPKPLILGFSDFDPAQIEHHEHRNLKEPVPLHR